MTVPYDADHASIYDLLYAGRGKDYSAESAALVRLVRERCPGAGSLLDVGCGTGGHLVHLRDEFADVAGVEISAPMREVAAGRLPGVPLHAADMRTFRTGRWYSAVVCMFSVIGYAGGPDGDVSGLRGAVASMAAHLEPGGVLVVEPWLDPTAFTVGQVGTDVTREGGSTLVRMSHSALRGRVSVLTFHYLAGGPGGLRHFTDVHELTLFTREEYLDALAAAGVAASYVDDPTFRRGLIVGTRER
jgi:dTDP-3-amino-3,4,6-trideoxy-alpha-D-glucopyranose N,N-dimethyltransferase